MLEKMVLSELEKYLLSVKETDTLREKQSRMEEEQKSRLYKEMQGLEHTKVRLEEELREAYEAYAKTQISREEYIAIKENQEVLLSELAKKTEKKTKEYEALLKEQQSHRESLKITASEIHLEKVERCTIFGGSFNKIYCLGMVGVIAYCPFYLKERCGYVRCY